jgi:hypothetical protein
MVTQPAPPAAAMAAGGETEEPMPRHTNGRGRRPGRYSEQQRAARAAADARLFDQSTADLADPELVEQRIRAALSGMSPRILGYSLRNQMLLLGQAEERGMSLRDVDTFNGWRQRGRQVRRGEQGLRLVRPVGLDHQEDTDAAPDHDEPDRSTDTERDEPPRVRFRFMAVFDISQTDEVVTDEDAEAPCAACGAAPGTPCLDGCGCAGCTGQLDPDEQEPADVAWNRLQEQIVQAGYAFFWPARPGDLQGLKVRLDHDTQAVHVAMLATAGDPEAITALAVALGEILTRAEQARRRTAVAALESAPTT